MIARYAQECWQFKWDEVMLCLLSLMFAPLPSCCKHRLRRRQHMRKCVPCFGTSLRRPGCIMHSKRVLSGSTSVLPRRALFRGTVRHASPSLYMKYAVIYQSFGSVQQIKLLKRGFTCVASSVAPAKRSRQPGAPRKTSQKAPPCPRVWCCIV